MAALRTLALGLALLVATPAAANPSGTDPVSRWRAEIAEASARFGVPVAWIERVMRAESGGRTMLGGRPITSHAGAMGLMQLMPRTWLAMRAAHGLGRDPHDPRDNILAGTAYLRAMYDRFGYGEGKFDQLVLLEAEQALLDARTAAVDALEQYHDAEARLARLTTPAPTPVQTGN